MENMSVCNTHGHIDGLVHIYSYPIANTLELLQSCTKQAIDITCQSYYYQTNPRERGQIKNKIDHSIDGFTT